MRLAVNDCVFFSFPVAVRFGMLILFGCIIKVPSLIWLTIDVALHPKNPQWIYRRGELPRGGSKDSRLCLH